MTTTAEIGMAPQKYEGKITTRIEEKTAQLPSGAYLGLAVGSMIASAFLQASGKRHAAIFIGQWVPSILVIGLYNKVVKIEQELLGLRPPTNGSRSAYGA